MTERKVDMVRLERPEEYFDREEVFGRDVGSVFPKAKTEAKSTGEAGSSQVEALASKRFISESELEIIKAARGLSAEDGSVAPLKPLSEVLRENKERKEAEFQGVWKNMKIGKNRPLEPEEIAFMDRLLEEEAERERQKKIYEDQGLDEYRALQAAREEAQREMIPMVEIAPKRPLPTAAPKPSVRPGIKIKPKAPRGDRKEVAPAISPSTNSTKRAGEEIDIKDVKKQLCSSTEEAGGAVCSLSSEGGLEGLLGGYGSDSGSGTTDEE